MNIKGIVSIGLPLVLAASFVSAQSMTDHPEKLTYAPITFTPRSCAWW